MRYIKDENGQVIDGHRASVMPKWQQHSGDIGDCTVKKIQLESNQPTTGGDAQPQETVNHVIVFALVVLDKESPCPLPKSHKVTPPSNPPHLKWSTVGIPDINTVDPRTPLGVTQHAQKSTTSTGVLMPESHVDPDASRAALCPQISTNTIPNVNTFGPNPPASDVTRDLQPFTNAMPSSDVVDPNPPSPKAAQHPSTSVMPSLDMVDPKPPLLDTIASKAQSNSSADISTLSTVETTGDGSFISSIPSDRSPSEKKKSSVILHPGPANTARNICARKWKESHPRGTTAEFKTHYDNLSSEDRQEYEKLVADMKNSSTAGSSGRAKRGTMGSS
ncbi:hypothetical protein PILCRDRAFT_871 [Piloderma croceum F 1598]|uniref:Uncharacterized protein n=1 Tax=Piloderma croceum (strain F 1598) TaxID=765440 RepID=A0A0C3GJE0_PILCF|nr:hypothetical protein PILCRDRAFT_871 [Piloderma croceum F 1598]